MVWLNNSKNILSFLIEIGPLLSLNWTIDLNNLKNIYHFFYSINIQISF